MGKLDKIVKDFYKEYQSYMKLDYMEEYKLDTKSAEDMRFTIAETKKKDGIRFLFLNKVFANDLLSGKKIERWKIGVLFHEFTHIADDRILEMNNISLRKKYIYRLYTEYHAEFIKTLYMFGIYPFPDNRTEISYTNKINSQYGCISIYDYLIKIKNGYADDIDISKINDMQSYISFFDRLSYYLGTASVYRIFCRYDLEGIMDISVFVNKLGKVAEKIKDTLLESIALGFDMEVAIESAKIYIPLIQPFLNK